MEGKGSFLNSGNFKEFARAMVDRGYREFVVDLNHCDDGLDLHGNMAGLALRLKELGQGHLRVVHCGKRSHELLAGLGLDQLFSITSNGANAPECECLKARPKRNQATRKSRSRNRKCWRRMRPFVGGAGELTRFKDVLDYLKQDLPREAASK